MKRFLTAILISGAILSAFLFGIVVSEVASHRPGFGLVVPGAPPTYDKPHTQRRILKPGTDTSGC